jgi:hypothetical protein
MMESIKNNTEQLNAMKAVKAAIDDPVNNNNCFFVQGPGGSGKTHVYRCATNYILSVNKNVCNMAWSGIAATLLLHGRTAHNAFKLPLHCERGKVACNVTPKTDLARTIASYDAFILDEASMVPYHALNAIDVLLTDLRQPNCKPEEKRPFGGALMLLGGDFAQIPPVMIGGQASDQVGMTIRNSDSWKFFTTYTLKTNMRLTDKNDIQHIQWLLGVANGTNSPNSVIIIPPHLNCLTDSIEDFIYPPDFDFTDEDSLFERSILCPKNDATLQMNEKILKLLPGKTFTYESVDSISTPDNESSPSSSSSSLKPPSSSSSTLDQETNNLIYPTEWLWEQTPSGLPPHILNLKEGAIVMLLRNLHVRNGLCNGTRMIVKKCRENYITCKLICGPRKGELVNLTRQDITSDAESELPIALKRRQFPIRLAYSMTINKSQGQSLKRVGVLLKTPCFTHGMFYVAVSRSRSKEGLKICAYDEYGQRTNQTANIVIPEILHGVQKHHKS